MTSLTQVRTIRTGAWLGTDERKEGTSEWRCYRVRALGWVGRKCFLTSEGLRFQEGRKGKHFYS